MTASAQHRDPRAARAARAAHAARTARWLTLALTLWLLAPPDSLGGGFDSPTALARTGNSSRFQARPNPWRNPSPSKQLEAFTARRRFQARVGLLNTSRDAERRTAERRLRQRGTRADLASYRRRIRREDDQDRLRLRVEADRLSFVHAPADADAWWRTLGPATRQSFLRSGLELRHTSREAERESRLRDVEREIEARRPTGFEVLDTPELP